MVEILESSFVVPSEETPKGRLRLSNLDQVAPRRHNCTIYFFQNNQSKDFFSADVLKAALAKALVLFYPIAGRHVVDHDGGDQIDCNAEGVLFVVARLDRTADSFNFEPMSPELRKLFVPSTEVPSLMQMLQVTYLKCGSVVLGTSNNHVFIDGRSATLLFQTWSSIARGDERSIIPPSFDNTPLRARSPAKINFDYPEYTRDDSKNEGTPTHCVTTKLHISKRQIDSLKRRCSIGNSTTRVSTFCAVSALVWKCYCIAKGLNPSTESRLMFTADIRHRLRPPLPENYFGNAVIRRYAISKVSEIASNPIGVVASTVKTTVDGITDESIRSFIDYLEVRRSERWSPPEKSSESDLRIRTICGMPIYDMDFGWGPPQLMSWERTNENRVVQIMDEPGKDAGIKVVPSLDSAIMQRFEKAFYEELYIDNNENDRLEFPLGKN